MFHPSTRRIAAFDLSTLAVFIPACFALNMAPGPNNLLSISNASRCGFISACWGGSGRLLAFAIMIALAAVGLTAVLHTSELLFHAIKIVGAAYLFYLAVQLWRAAPEAEGGTVFASRGLGALARQEFLVAIGTPKAILLFTAFLPQYVDRSRVAPIRTTGRDVSGAGMYRHRALLLDGRACAASVCQTKWQASVQPDMCWAVSERSVVFAGGAAGLIVPSTRMQKAPDDLHRQGLFFYQVPLSAMHPTGITNRQQRAMRRRGRFFPR